jgi:hypothetical protein
MLASLRDEMQNESATFYYTRAVDLGFYKEKPSQNPSRCWPASLISPHI